MTAKRIIKVVGERLRKIDPERVYNEFINHFSGNQHQLHLIPIGMMLQDM